MPDFNTFIETLQEWAATHNWQIKLIYSVLSLAGLWILRLILIRFVYNRTEDLDQRHRWRKAIEYASIFIGLVLVLRIWLTEIGSFATYLGLLSAGVAIALADVLSNIVGWSYIITRRPFVVGDRVQIAENAGDVVDIRFSHFSIIEIGNWVTADQSTGRVLHIPNRRVFTHVLANYTSGFGYIWNEIVVKITLESNWTKAKTILDEILHQEADKNLESAFQEGQELARRVNVRLGHLTPIVYTAVKDYQIHLAMRYLVRPRQRRRSESTIWEEILIRFAVHDDIQLAAPTQRVFVNPLEEGRPPNAPNSGK